MTFEKTFCNHSKSPKVFLLTELPIATLLHYITRSSTEVTNMSIFTFICSNQRNVFTEFYIRKAETVQHVPLAKSSYSLTTKLVCVKLCIHFKLQERNLHDSLCSFPYDLLSPNSGLAVVYRHSRWGSWILALCNYPKTDLNASGWPNSWLLLLHEESYLKKLHVDRWDSIACWTCLPFPATTGLYLRCPNCL